MTRQLSPAQVEELSLDLRRMALEKNGIRVGSSDEIALLETALLAPSPEDARRLQELSQKRENEGLSATEHAQVAVLGMKSEQITTRRLVALTELAQKRNCSLQEVMNELGLVTAPF